jgi:chaperonin GroES
MTIKPLQDRILVEPTEVKTTTAGGILLTEVEKPVTGTVIEVGAGTIDDPMLLKSGDKVMYNKLSGVEIPVNGKLILMLRQGDVLAIFED